ncbi:MAG: hypothetical protein R3F13_13265 [Prosthecobacter sp.]
MSTDESAALDQLRVTIRWLIGGIASLLVGAASVGAWVATQQNEILQLKESDRVSISDRAEIRAELKAHNSLLSAVRQDAALQNRDLQYIREAVTEIKQVLKKP